MHCLRSSKWLSIRLALLGSFLFALNSHDRTIGAPATCDETTPAVASTPAPPAASRQAVPRPGLTVIWGGGEAPDGILERFTRAAADGKTALVVSEEQQKQVEPLIARLREKEITATTLRPDDASLADQLRDFDVVWLDAASLPAAAMPLDQVLISTDFLQETPPAATLERLKQQPGLVGLGVPPGAGLVASGREWKAIGAGDVVVCLPTSATQPAARPLLLKHLKSGQDADLLALSRAAIARLGARFPPEHPPEPNVTSGSLLACGGGSISDEIWQRFIELAGGVDAPIVVLPIANPGDLAPSLVGRLKRLGCTDVTVLAQNTKKQVESAEFVAALKRAKGVFFGGGRQWRYVDAYEGTVAEELLRDVLTRGGVIAGSSAGSAIQGQYMVRGNPLGNLDIMAEGYERGIGFLPGAAIDIHVGERGRLKEMVELVRVFPQLLGISLDEGAAAEIHGPLLTVHGKGKTHIVTKATDEPLPLVAGDRYHLVERKKID